MTQPTKRFVVAIRNILLPSGVLIEKDDVGILTARDGSIFFVRVWQDVTLSPNDYQLFNVSTTGDPYPKKICNICHKLLPTTDFARNQNNIQRPVRRPSCQRCRQTLEGRTPTPKEKARWLRTKPNLEPFECPICGKRTIAGVNSKVVLDHNHRTGAIRDWVCDSCNTGIGRFKDDIELMKKAIEYLEG